MTTEGVKSAGDRARKAFSRRMAMGERAARTKDCGAAVGAFGGIKEVSKLIFFLRCHEGVACDATSKMKRFVRADFIFDRSSEGRVAGEEQSRCIV